MEKQKTSTIRISEQTLNELNKLKYHYGLKSIEDLIIKYIFEEPEAYKQNEKTE